jgi:mycofactocin precursor
MTDLMADPKAATTTAPVADETDHEELVEEELLVEDVSIDGMCGVY